MKHLVLMLALMVAPMVAPAVAAADSPDHVINVSGRPHSLDCGDGGEVTVNGGRNQIKISGGCKKVTVNGGNNQIAVEATDKIVINGAKNQVVYGRGHTRKTPKIVKRGSGNTVSRRK